MENPLPRRSRRPALGLRQPGADVGDNKAGCSSLMTGIDQASIGLPSGGATIDSATLIAASPLAVAERGRRRPR